MPSVVMPISLITDEVLKILTPYSDKLIIGTFNKKAYQTCNINYVGLRITPVTNQLQYYSATYLRDSTLCHDLDSFKRQIASLMLEN